MPQFAPCVSYIQILEIHLLKTSCPQQRTSENVPSLFAKEHSYPSYIPHPTLSSCIQYKSHKHPRKSLLRTRSALYSPNKLTSQINSPQPTEQITLRPNTPSSGYHSSPTETLHLHLRALQESTRETDHVPRHRPTHPRVCQDHEKLFTTEG